MSLKRIALTLDTLSALCIATAVTAVLVLRGSDQRVVSRIAGVILIICMSASQRAARASDEILLNSEENGNRAMLRVRDAFSLAAIGTSIVVGWLIYYVTDTFDHRRTYLIVSAIITACCILASRTIDHLAKK